MEIARPLVALNSHGVIGPLIIMSASRITMYSASVFTWLIQCTTAAGLLIAGYLKCHIDFKGNSTRRYFYIPFCVLAISMQCCFNQSSLKKKKLECKEKEILLFSVLYLFLRVERLGVTSGNRRKRAHIRSKC